MFSCVKNISVLMEYITSDHLPLSVAFSYDHLPNLTKLPQRYNNVKLHWEKLSREELFQYHEASTIALAGIKLNEEITNCSDQFFTTTTHVDAINQLNHDLTSALILAPLSLAGSSRIPQNPAGMMKSKTLHSVTRKYFLLWVAKRKPKSGLTYEDMVSSKKESKYALRACKSKVKRRRADKLDSALAADVAKKKFWSLARMTSAKAFFLNNTDDAVGPQNITETWQQYYSTLLNSHKKDNKQNEQVQLSL